jgi:hypothetical protein
MIYKRITRKDGQVSGFIYFWLTGIGAYPASFSSGKRSSFTWIYIGKHLHCLGKRLYCGHNISVDYSGKLRAGQLFLRIIRACPKGITRSDARTADAFHDL